ncbi:hypothetical protein CQZ93_12650 [Ochrobactrum vermis]|nr:hypothetical protein CQZ93_12650 [Ochrobactrum vermis]
MLVSSCYQHRISPSKGGFKRGCAGKTGSNREKQNSCQLADVGKLTANFLKLCAPEAQMQVQGRGGVAATYPE